MKPDERNDSFFWELAWLLHRYRVSIKAGGAFGSPYLEFKGEGVEYAQVNEVNHEICMELQKGK